MTATPAKQAGPPSPRAGLPASPLEAGLELEALMVAWAEARRAVTRSYAAAYLAAVGPDGIRTQEAKKAAADAQYRLDCARAAVEGFKVMLNGELNLGAPDADDTADPAS